MSKKLLILTLVVSFINLSSCNKKEEPPVSPIKKPTTNTSVTQTQSDIHTIVTDSIVDTSTVSEVTLELVKVPAIVEISSTEEFSQIISGSANRLIVVDMYTDWCQPCQVLSPIIAALGTKYHTEVTFLKVNIEKFPDIGSDYDVRGFPLVFFIKDSKVVESISGLGPKSEYDKKIAALK